MPSCVFCQVFLKKCVRGWSVRILGFSARTRSPCFYALFNTQNCKIVTKKSQDSFSYTGILRKLGVFVKYFLSPRRKKRVFRRFCGWIDINYSIGRTFCQIIFVLVGGNSDSRLFIPFQICIANVDNPLVVQRGPFSQDSHSSSGQFCLRIHHGGYRGRNNFPAKRTHFG